MKRTILNITAIFSVLCVVPSLASAAPTTGQLFSRAETGNAVAGTAVAAYAKAVAGFASAMRSKDKATASQAYGAITKSRRAALRGMKSFHDRYQALLSALKANHPSGSEFARYKRAKAKRHALTANLARVAAADLQVQKRLYRAGCQADGGVAACQRLQKMVRSLTRLSKMSATSQASVAKSLPGV